MGAPSGMPLCSTAPLRRDQHPCSREKLIGRHLLPYRPTSDLGPAPIEAKLSFGTLPCKFLLQLLADFHCILRVFCT